MIWRFTVQEALFLLSFIIFGILGYQRGWRRETVSLLFLIVGVVFLNLSGGYYLSKLLYQFLEGKSISDASLLRGHPNVLPVVTIASLAVIIALGYGIGNNIFRNEKLSSQDRTLGLIPGIIAGAVVAAELTYYLLPGTEKTVISTIQMNLNFIGNLTVLLIFVIAVVVVVIGLMATRTKKSGGGGGEKK